MNFEEYKQAREAILEERDPLRLDCMNPFKAMEFLKTEHENLPDVSSDEVLGRMLILLDFEQHSGFAIPSRGVRSSLHGLFRHIGEQKSELWIPDDVYPFYEQSARAAGIDPRFFSTLPAPAFSFTSEAAARSTVLLTNPVSPLGRYMTNSECDAIVSWLNQSKDRRVIIDTVYSYSHSIDAHSQRLFATEQCFITHSLSKAWLERGIFGVLFAPEKDRAMCLEVLESPSQEECNMAFRALAGSPELPQLQQKTFNQEWKRLAPMIQQFVPGFTPPSTGYFICVPANFLDVLHTHNALLIPASVFGSSRMDLSIATCLYDAKYSVS